MAKEFGKAKVITDERRNAPCTVHKRHINHRDGVAGRVVLILASGREEMHLPICSGDGAIGTDDAGGIVERATAGVPLGVP